VCAYAPFKRTHVVVSPEFGAPLFIVLFTGTTTKEPGGRAGAGVRAVRGRETRGKEETDRAVSCSYINHLSGEIILEETRVHTHTLQPEWVLKSGVDGSMGRTRNIITSVSFYGGKKTY